MRKASIAVGLIKTGLFLLMTCMSMLLVCTKDKQGSGTEQQTVVYHCPMHPTYMAQKQGKCPICGMNLVLVNGADPEKAQDAHATGVKIDPAMIQSSGVQTEKAALRTLTRDIRTSATIVVNERRVKIITTKIMGYVEKLHVDHTGQSVKKGQPLYDVYSPELVSAQAEYLQMSGALALHDSGGQLLQSSRMRLLNWDVSEAQINELEKRGVPQKTLTVVAQYSGTVTEKMVVEGQSIDAGMQLYKLVDYSDIWVEGAIYQQDVPFVDKGQDADITLDYFPGEQYRGTVSFIAPEMDGASRTLMIRVEMANTPDLKIKPGMNATMTLHAVTGTSVVTVPEQAVIHSGLRTIVIIAHGNGYFSPREVTTGQSAGGYTEVTKGVSEGDEIVVSSQFLIDSESNLKTAVMQMDRGNLQKDDAKSGSDSAVSGTQTGGTPSKASKQSDQSAGPQYICTMCPEVLSNQPGSCPKCGMDLTLK